MRLKAIGTAAAALALALALPGLAHAATDWTVTGSGSCNNSDRNCPTIAAAVGAAASGDTVFVNPGTWGGATISQDVLTLKGIGSGLARVNGQLTFTGDGTGAQSVTIDRLAVFAPSGGNALRITSGSVSDDKTVSLSNSIFSGAGATAAIHAQTEVALNTIAITARHVTVADSGSAPAWTEAGDDAAMTAAFHDSIVVGATADPLTGTNNQPTDASNEPTSGRDALFADWRSEDFHLLWNAPAVNAAGSGGGATPADADGEPRSGSWDRGGDEYVNYAPTATIHASPTTTERGKPVAFSASASDANQAQGDGVIEYRWSFGDGATAKTTDPAVAHAYEAAGTYQATVRVVDRTNTEGPASPPVTIRVNDPPPPGLIGPDGTIRPFSIDQLPGFEAGTAPGRRGPDTEPPVLSFEFPRASQTVRIGRARPLLRGRNADFSGVRRVELALTRREGTRCRWYDGRAAFRLGRCDQPVWFKGTVDDYDWYYVFPRAVRPRPGAYVAAVRATDYVGNQGTSAPVAFRWAR